MSQGQLQVLWKSMLRIRRIEEAIAEKYSMQEMRCPVHLSIGQEAVAVGVCEALNNDDIVYSGHRSHAHYLAKGGDLTALIAELYGKSTGCSGGKGGSMHVVDFTAGFWGATPIVAGTVPIAVGAAWAAKLQHSSRVVTIFFGDGCFEEGVMHESLNFASLHQLPVLFVCENNGYSVYTNLKSRQPYRSISNLVNAHGIHSVSGDGNDVLYVNQESSAAIERIRKGEGPQFLEFSTFRWLEHCGPNDDDDLGYREDNELSSWRARCPIELILRKLNVDSDELSDQKSIESEINSEIESAFNAAQNADMPIAGDYSEYA